MKIRLKLFSIAKDLAGFDERVLELPSGASASSVADHLTSLNPQFKSWQSSVRMAVNQEYVGQDHMLRENDEVAVIPPVSGG